MAIAEELDRILCGLCYAREEQAEGRKILSKGPLFLPLRRTTLIITLEP